MLIGFVVQGGDRDAEEQKTATLEARSEKIPTPTSGLWRRVRGRAKKSGQNENKPSIAQNARTPTREYAREVSKQLRAPTTRRRKIKSAVERRDVLI